MAINDVTVWDGVLCTLLCWQSSIGAVPWHKNIICTNTELQNCIKYAKYKQEEHDFFVDKVLQNFFIFFLGQKLTNSAILKEFSEFPLKLIAVNVFVIFATVLLFSESSVSVENRFKKT